MIGESRSGENHADTPFADAVRQAATCEPPGSEPELTPVIEAAANIHVEMSAIVEQDMYPCEPDQPFPITSAHAPVPQPSRAWLG